MQFLWKYFNLSKLVNQGNNFVIYEDFFENDGSIIYLFYFKDNVTLLFYLLNFFIRFG